MSTSDKLNNILTAKKNIKDAIQAKGVSIPDDLPFSQYASKISEIQAGGGEIPDTSFSVEYTLYADTYYVDRRIDDYNESRGLYPALPRIYSSATEYSYTYDKIEITLLDGTITDDLTTLVNDTKKIRIWYPEDTISVKFYGNNDNHLVESVDYIKTDNFTDMSEMFNFCGYLKSINLSNFNTSNVTDMSNMFNACSILRYLDLSNFDTSKVTSMKYMFRYCSVLRYLVLTDWDTSSVTNMSWMFNNCTSLTSLDLSNYNTSNVTDMRFMFYNCSNLTSLDLSSFDTRNVTNMNGMFNSVPTTVDWHYDGTNYQNWTLTESQTSFSGTFPWNLDE